MDIHKNARLTPHGRERLAKMIVNGQTPEAASEAVGVCPRTGRKWADRFQQEGLAGLQDRSSRPHRLRQPTPPEVIEWIESLRRQCIPGKEIAATVGVSAATVSRVLKRLGLSKLSALEPAQPPRRYQREQPGEMIHIDIKSSASSIRSAIASPATARARATAAASDGSSSMSASTTPRAWPSARS